MRRHRKKHHKKKKGDKTQKEKRGLAVEKVGDCTPVLLPVEIWKLIIEYSDPAFLLRSVAPNYKNDWIFMKTQKNKQELFHFDMISGFLNRNSLHTYMLFWIYKPHNPFSVMDLSALYYKEFGIMYDTFVEWIPFVRAYYGDLNTVEECMMYSYKKRKYIYFFSVIGGNPYFASTDFIEKTDFFQGSTDSIVLDAALLCPNSELAKPLIDKYIPMSINVLYKEGKSPVSVLIKKKKLDYLQYIISKYSDLLKDLNPREYAYCMESAIESNDLTLIKALSDCGFIKPKYLIRYLCSAIMKGHLEVVDYLLNKYADDLILLEKKIEKKKVDIFGNPLGLAAKHGHLEIVKVLLDHGSNIKQIVKKKTIIDCACDGGHLDVVKELLARNIDFRDKLTLFPGIRHGHLHIVKYLVEAGIGLTDFDQSFVLAIKREERDIVEYFLTFETIRSRLGEIRNNLLSPLMIACLQGEHSIIKMLLDTNSDYIDDMTHVERKWSEEKSNPLLWASKMGNFDLMEILIRYGADLNLKNDFGKTPFLLFLSSSPKVEEIQHLLSIGACLNDTDNEGNHALMYLVKGRGDSLRSTLEYFSTLEFDFDRRNDKGQNALMTILQKSGTPKKKFLALQEGSNISFESVDSEGNNLLMYFLTHTIQYSIHGASDYSGTIGEEDAEMINLLVEMGSDINHRNNTGKTPLMFIRDDCYFCVENLLRLGADLHSEDDFGKNVLIHAIQEDKAYLSGYLVRVTGFDINAIAGCGISALEAAEESQNVGLRNAFNLAPPTGTFAERGGFGFGGGNGGFVGGFGNGGFGGGNGGFGNGGFGGGNGFGGGFGGGFGNGGFGGGNGGFGNVRFGRDSYSDDDTSSISSESY